MATKALNVNQHHILHELYPDDCCLCKAENEIDQLKAENARLKDRVAELEQKVDDKQDEINHLQEEMAD
uniref:Uncharacterized protein n=1 Tax=viral metagenome TaxID=1070528 RepID=A0A6M3LD01_9ZZZZ